MAHRKVGNGEGSLYFSDAENKWIFQYYYNGKQKKIRQKKNEKVKDFKARVTTLKNSLNTDSYIEKTNVTIFELGKELLENKHNRNETSDTTYYRDLSTLDLIKKNDISNIKIQKISYYQIQDFLDQQKNYSQSSIDKLYHLMGQIFIEAIKRDYIIKNPMIKTTKPKSDKQKRKIEAFSVDEQKTFLAQLENEKFKNIFIIAIYTGMRMGEILALKKDDIDFTKKTIYIQRSLTKDEHGNSILGTKTKTYNSIRVIPITPLFEKELKQSVKNMIPNKNNLIFTRENKDIITFSMMNLTFNRICTRANLGVITTEIKRKDRKKERTIIHKKSKYNQHMLRHTYATRCIESGISAEVLQKLLGHTDIQTTINTYTTIFDRFKTQQIDLYIKYIESL